MIVYLFLYLIQIVLNIHNPSVDIMNHIVGIIAFIRGLGNFAA
jgi:hypothetical protein